MHCYYESKQAMFDAVLPESFVARFRGLVRRRVQAYRSWAQSNPHGMYAVASAELVAFCIKHRVRVVVVLSQDMSSPYGGASRRS